MYGQYQRSAINVESTVTGNRYGKSTYIIKQIIYIPFEWHEYGLGLGVSDYYYEREEYHFARMEYHFVRMKCFFHSVNPFQAIK